MCWIWFLLQPITLALVYVGTTLKDLSDVTHGWSEFSKTRWVRDLTFFFSLLPPPPFSPNLGMLSFYPAQHMATETRTIAHLIAYWQLTEVYMFIKGMKGSCRADFMS